ncbi:hypothetical protein [Fulvivirga sediminis]|uniref:Lipoprotein n=1 Tax=Fulvivirga sediminis TaxID=2803949 RepID=A0A937F7B9_9BACT|nr:hypothetical protein [Fulvivirga sediminis]MBL3655323.1 hypothetical protein [Fulvivirga sediminis]
MKHINSCLILLSSIFIACSSNSKENESGEKYSILVEFNDDRHYHNPEREKKRTERYLSKDSLYIFFETDYSYDTIDIKINSIQNKTVYLTTDGAVGVADVAILGKIETIDKIEIRKNYGKPLIIDLKDKSMNLWTVNFYLDTLRANRRKYLSWYE